MTNHVSNKEHFLRGVKSALPIAVGYIPIAIAFGLLAKSVGIPSYITSLMSFLIFAGASQFIGVNLIVLGASWWEIVITTFIINLRHFLMTAAITQRLEKNAGKKWRMLLAFGVTDETFSVASFQNDKVLSRYYVLGLNVVAFASWNFGTWIGLFFADGFPELRITSYNVCYTKLLRIES